jgi:hypothetical protein
MFINQKLNLNINDRVIFMTRLNHANANIILKLLF